MVGLICYLVPGACLLLWTSWRFQRGLSNIAEDFTVSSSFLLLTLGGMLLIVLWPLLAISWLSLMRNETRSNCPQAQASETAAKNLARGL